MAGHGVAGFFNNATTAMTRRFKNIMTDERTHSIFERFLGLPVSSGAAGPLAATAGGGEASPGRDLAGELAAAAQALPACDDADSDEEGDVLGARQWPTRGLASPGRGGGPEGALPEEADIVSAVEPDAPVATAPPAAADPLAAGEPAPVVASHRTPSYVERVSAAVDAAGPDLLALESPKAGGAAAAADRDDAAAVYGADVVEGGGSAHDNPFDTSAKDAGAVRAHDPFAGPEEGSGAFEGFDSSANGGSRGGGEEWSDGHLGPSLL